MAERPPDSPPDPGPPSPDHRVAPPAVTEPPAPASAAPARRRPGCLRRRVVRPLLWLLIVLAAYAGWQALTWPDVAALAEKDPQSTAFIRRAQRQGEVQWRWVPYGNISPHLKRAVLVSEDIGFHGHDGFADEEIRVALDEAWREKRLPRGASTITQQVAKNLWLSGSYNPLRKIEEALLTRQLERHLSKRRILEIYLNVAELGPGIFGAEAASRHYYGKSAAGLSEWEAAQLAAGLPRPKSWHPGVSSGGYRWKTNLILRRMGEAGWLWKVI